MTGGSGYVGVNLVPALTGRGDDVTVLDRTLHPLLQDSGVRFVVGDVRDGGSVAAAAAGCDVVYHLAAVISVVGGMGGLVEAVNVGGAANAAAAARGAGARLVMCSSVHAFDTRRDRQRVDEDSPRAEGRGFPAYDRSKAAAEVAVRAEVERGLDAVVVNPTGIVGPRDPGPSRTGAMLQALRERRLPAVIAGGFDWVDVRDVVAGLLAAEARGRTGENYLLPGHRRSLRELADAVSRVSGVPAPRITLPLWFARLWSPAATLVARRTLDPLLYTGDTLAAIEAFPHVDGTKAAVELGHTPRPLELTLTDLFTWFDSGEYAGLHPAARAPTTAAPGSAAG